MLSSNIFRYLDEPLYESAFWPAHNHFVHYPGRNNFWSTSVSVHGYEPSEIAIKEDKDERGDLKIVIHAKHESEDHFSQLRKTVKIPKDVDHENIRTILSKDGVLLIKGLYKDRGDLVAKPVKVNREDTWNGIWGELGRLNDQMNQIIGGADSVSNTRTEYVASGDNSGEGSSGVWRLRMNVGKDFQPDEIKVRSHNDHIHVEAAKESKGNNSWSSRYFKEVISIPDGVEQDKLKSRLTGKGELIVEASCRKMPATEVHTQGKDLPIEIDKTQDLSDTMAVDNQ